MIYRVVILRRAQRELRDIPASVYPRLKEAISTLGNDPRPRSSKKLSSREGWRMRVGDYRVIYEIEDSVRVVTVEHVGHRRNVYRR